MKKIIFFISMILFSFSSIQAGIGPGDTSDIHIISIGIQNYPKLLGVFNNCISDSELLIDKIKLDNKERNVNAHTLYDENATLDEIRKTFKTVAKSSKPGDVFIFFYAGHSAGPVLTAYSPELYQSVDTFTNYYKAKEMIKAQQRNILSTHELARLMEQISCKDQLIISEAGNGRQFAEALIAELFESNPIIAEGTERNRIILTSRTYGLDWTNCSGKRIENGPLLFFILQNTNITDIFDYPEYYEFELTKSEIECDNANGGKKYLDIYYESSFRNIIIKQSNIKSSRGVITEEVGNDESDQAELKPTIYALIIATNNYDASTNWNNLLNPKNDAESISRILEEDYNVVTKELYDAPKDSVLMEIRRFKNRLRNNDKFILFIAGHGYYSKDFSDGYIVFKDSKSLSNDVSMGSYLQMATLNLLMDNLPTQNVFCVFDICFGASFDLTSKDLALSNYTDLEMDISLAEFDSRKSAYMSRIFLASGRYEVADYWYNSGDHSPFAAKMINTLENESEFMTPGKLYSRMAANINEPVLKQFGKHDPKGDFILRKR